MSIPSFRITVLSTSIIIMSACLRREMANGTLKPLVIVILFVGVVLSINPHNNRKTS